MDLAVIPECFVDTNLVETLVPPKRQYNHQKGCGTVTKVMQERFSDDFALGIIDKDKREVDYLKEFTVIASSKSLFLHKHKTRPHYIIQINPAMEVFIMDNAKEVGLSLTDFNLPLELDQLKKTSKTVNSKNDERFKRLFRALLAAGAQELLRLAAWIAYLKENRYSQIDATTIKNM